MGAIPTYGRTTTYWTRERVLAGMRRFHHETGQAPTATHDWQAATRGGARSPHLRRYPSFYGVLRYFRTFREAWAAVGVETDRNHLPWTPVEDWYLREGVGILTRNELAADLKRRPLAVKTRLRELGIHTYEAKGWSLNRVERTLQVPSHYLRAYLERGELPYFRGSKCIYVDPADLLVLRMVDWSVPPPSLEQAIRRSLVERLVKVLAGQDWRAGRLYQAQRERKTDRNYQWRVVEPGVPPQHIRAGSRVRCTERVPGKGAAFGREGLVQLVYWRHHGERCWMAKVDFPREKGRRIHGERVKYTLPISALAPVGAARRWHFDGLRFAEVQP